MSLIESFRALLYYYIWTLKSHILLGGWGDTQNIESNSISILVMRCVKYELKANVLEHKSRSFEFYM